MSLTVEEARGPDGGEHGEGRGRPRHGHVGQGRGRGVEVRGQCFELGALGVFDFGRLLAFLAFLLLFAAKMMNK